MKNKYFCPKGDNIYRGLKKKESQMVERNRKQFKEICSKKEYKLDRQDQ